MKLRRRLWLIRHCPHVRQRGIYGDEIHMTGGRRAQCLDCGRWLRSLPGKQFPRNWFNF